MWILGKLTVHAANDVVPLNLHEGIPVWSRLLMGHSHAMEQLVDSGAAISAARDPQVQLLIPWHVERRKIREQRGTSWGHITGQNIHVLFAW